MRSAVTSQKVRFNFSPFGVHMKLDSLQPAVKPVISKLQESTQRMAPYWVAASMTALFSVIYAKIFGWSEALSFSWNQQNPLWSFVITPTTMLASALLAHYLSPQAAGSGIPQLLAAVEISRQPSPMLEKLLNIKMIVAKFLGSCICVAGGGTTGREGPMLQISAGLFNQVQKYWPKVLRTQAPNMQSMILAGGAAGLASAFNTPLGGVIFAIEELAKVHISHIRTYVFHAVVIAGILAQAIMGNYLYFGKIHVLTIPVQEIIPLITASVMIGLLGAIFGRAVVWVLDSRSRMTFRAKIASTVFLGFAVAAFSFIFGRDGMGSGREVIVHILSAPDSPAPYYLGFVRAISNYLTYAGGVIGGIFAPALSTGAAFGSWMSSFDVTYNHQLWALAGMVAFLTGVTRTPFTSLILVLEMTDTHDVIIFLMLAAIVAQSAAKFIDPISFYEHMAHRMVHGKPPEKHEE